VKDYRAFFSSAPWGPARSTIGRLLARALKLGFADSDTEIEQRTGADIPWIFDVEGEAGFRDREEQVIDEMTLLDHTVLATGGGVVMRESNRRLLADRADLSSTCTLRSRSSCGAPAATATAHC
jgi:shikimate kinase